METSRLLLFVHVTLCALIGGFAANEIEVRFAYGSYLWSMGAFFGGFLGYWSVDTPQIRAGIVHAYRNAIGWEPNRPYWKAYFSWVVAWATLFTTVVCILLVTFSIIERRSLFYVPNATALQIVIVAGICSVVCLFVTFGTVVVNDFGRPDNVTDEEYALLLEEQTRKAFRVILRANPIGIIIGTIYCLLQLLWMLWMLVRVPFAVVVFASAVPTLIFAIGRSIRAFGLLVAGVFMYVHSERRVRRLVYATIGAMVGHLFASAIVGATTGGVLAVVAYELTPLRWLMPPLG